MHQSYLTINRFSSKKILRVTVSESLSVCGHQCVQAMWILHANGMATNTIHVIFDAVVIVKRTYLHHRGRALQWPRIVNDWKQSFVMASILDFALLLTSSH